MVVSNVERQRRRRNRGEPQAGSPEQAEIERLQAMVAGRNRELADLDAQSYESALKARLAELKADVPESAPQAGRRTSIGGEDEPLIRRHYEEGHYHDDAEWTADDDTTRAVLEWLTLRRHGPRGEDASLIAKLADLLERDGLRFIAALRREVTAIKARAAAAAAAKAKAKAKRQKDAPPATAARRRRKARAA
jgi:hypothetical protein